MEAPEHVVKDLSPVFRAAAHRGDRTEALRAGRAIMQACHTVILHRGHQTARWAWARRLGFFSRPADLQEVLHYEEIARTVSLILQQMGVVELHEDQRPEEVAEKEAPLIMQEPTMPSRAEELREVERELSTVEVLFGKILDVLQRGEVLTHGVVQRIDETVRRTDLGQDQLFRYYVERARPRSICSVPLVGILVFTLLLFWMIAKL